MLRRLGRDGVWAVSVCPDSATPAPEFDQSHDGGNNQNNFQNMIRIGIPNPLEGWSASNCNSNGRYARHEPKNQRPRSSQVSVVEPFDDDRSVRDEDADCPDDEYNLIIVDENHAANDGYYKKYYKKNKLSEPEIGPAYAAFNAEQQEMPIHFRFSQMPLE